jgi:asparagine synthase (glutamine-hydrolysing)
MGAATGLEVRHPYFDVRVLEFCLDLPSEEKDRDGWPRWIVRQSMEGVVPDKIRWRYGKARLGHQFRRAMLRHEKQRLDDLFSKDVAVIDSFVDIPNARAAYQRFVEGKHSGSDAMAVWCSAMLARWLTSGATAG